MGESVKCVTVLEEMGFTIYQTQKARNLTFS